MLKLLQFKIRYGNNPRRIRRQNIIFLKSLETEFIPNSSKGPQTFDPSGQGLSGHVHGPFQIWSRNLTTKLRKQITAGPQF